jgi:hypothetical protein
VVLTEALCPRFQDAPHERNRRIKEDVEPYRPTLVEEAERQFVSRPGCAGQGSLCRGP